MYPQGYNILCKVHFIVPNDDYLKIYYENKGLTRVELRKASLNGIVSTVFNGFPSQELISNQLENKIINKFNTDNSSNNVVLLYDINFFVVGLDKNGGCSSCKKVEQKLKYKDRIIKLISPKSSNDNCLFMCFIHYLKKSGNSFNLQKIRQELNLIGKISYSDVSIVANYFNCDFVLLNEKQEIISYRNIENKNGLHIMLMNQHYYIIEFIDYIKCKQCGRKLREDNSDHVCNNKRISFYSKQKCGKSEYVDMINCEEKQMISNDKMIFFDLETFQDTVCHVPYACGYSIGDHKNVNISYGKDCMNNLIDHLMTVEEKIICAYNGSGFDFYILLNFLKDKKVEIKNIIMFNGSILSFKFGKEGKENKVFDLYRFINSSLSKACDSYKIENRKMTFDVLKIQSWDDSEKYRHEVEPYLKYDVLSLSELFFKFNEQIYKKDYINITSFVTLSNMAYCLWQKTLIELVEIPDIDKYNFIKLSTYGARTYPNQKEFKSKYYDDIINKNMNYDDLIKTKDYIFNADATSLYPASMAGFKLCKVKYPIGKSRWSENPEEEYRKNKYGIYEIDFFPPKNITVPILPRKKELGLEWSLLDGSGVYTNIDIKNAIESGYKIVFKNKCLVWDKTGNVFKTYVNKYYKMKCKAEKKPKNPVKRSIAKLILNAMYGKTLQKAIYNTTTIINNYQELLKFWREYDVTDISVLDENKLLLSGTAIDKETKITKPCQLGSFVLAFSRQIMLNYMKAIDPTLKTPIFTYTDTDSLHILGEHEMKLRELGYIKNKNDASLGYLCSDVDNEGIIIYENNLAPKTYFYEYIDNNNIIHDKNSGTMKSKGIPHKCLTYEMYDMTNNDINRVCEFSGLKKKHKTLTYADKEKGVNHFSIVNNTQTRTFNKSDWSGFNLLQNIFYPKGYCNVS